MYLVTGCNLFGQWCSEKYLFDGFKPLSIDKSKLPSKTSSSPKVLCISWSYNVFLIDKQVYVSGSFKGEDNQLTPLKLPAEIKTSGLLVAGNDYKLILAVKNSPYLWIMNLEKENEIKKISLNVETPLQGLKKMKMNDGLVKMVMKNDTCLYLTSSGTVYSGILPSHVDTTHCVGKVCDIQCGYEHCVLLTDAGFVYTWGNGRRLQLGHGDVMNQTAPVELEGLAGIKIVKIRAGGWHTMALSESGDLYTWGLNDTGQLGIKIDKTKECVKSLGVPTLVDIYEGSSIVEKNIKDIACGSKHSMILLEDNTIWITGCNKYGQLGASPQKVKKLYYFKKIYQSDKAYELICGKWCSVLQYAS